MNDARRFAHLLAVPIVGLLVAASVGAASAAALPTARDVLSARASAAATGLSLPPPSRGYAQPDNRASGKIKHVIIIMQENRSFDNLFQGYPGADTQSFGFDSNGKQIALQPIPLESPYDINHDILSYMQACNGTGSIPGTNCQMNGFNLEPSGCRSCTDPQYGYVPAAESAPYFALANQYVLGDRMFTSHIDDSFISHQYIIAAQANGSAYFPSSSWGCEGGSGDVINTLTQQRQFGAKQVVCWDINTLGDELDAAHNTWRFYASGTSADGGIWSSYQAIKHIYYGPDWAKDVISPHQQILTDIQNGQLANVTWVMPTCVTSDHAGCGGNQGPAWVTSVVNAIGESKFWKSSAIFVTWDEWGGWYDHVAPPYEDYDGLGMRVPLIIISPFAKQNYVSHVQYEQGSILRFAEDQFGLAPLSAADTRATSPAADAFNFKRHARKFQPFTSKLSQDYFIHRAPADNRIPDAE